MCTQYLLEYFQNSQYSVLTRVLFLSTRFIPGYVSAFSKTQYIIIIRLTVDFGHYKKQVGVCILKIRAKLLKLLILLTYSMLVRSQQSRFCIIVHCSAPIFNEL